MATVASSLTQIDRHQPTRCIGKSTPTSCVPKLSHVVQGKYRAQGGHMYLKSMLQHSTHCNPGCCKRIPHWCMPRDTESLNIRRFMPFAQAIRECGDHILQAVLCVWKFIDGLSPEPFPQNDNKSTTHCARTEHSCLRYIPADGSLFIKVGFIFDLSCYDSPPVHCTAIKE